MNENFAKFKIESDYKKVDIVHIGIEFKESQSSDVIKTIMLFKKYQSGNIINLN